MNARTIRRAIERKEARKEARKAQKLATKEAAKALAAAPGSFAGPDFSFDEAAAAPRPLSEARLSANRHNAQLSTGPKTEAGKSISSRNAVRTALTGRTVLLPSDDADRYEQHCRAFFDELSPAGQRETLLAQSLADIAWRIERIAGFEMAIYAKGRSQFADAHPHEPAALRSALIEHDIYQANERELRNLHLQEARLRRQRDKDNEELRRLQSERRAGTREQQELATALAALEAEQNNRPLHPTPVGFDFSTPELRPVRQAAPDSAASQRRTEAA